MVNELAKSRGGLRWNFQELGLLSRPRCFCWVTNWFIFEPKSHCSPGWPRTFDWFPSLCLLWAGTAGKLFSQDKLDILLTATTMWDQERRTMVTKALTSLDHCRESRSHLSPGYQENKIIIYTCQTPLMAGKYNSWYGCKILLTFKIVFLKKCKIILDQEVRI